MTITFTERTPLLVPLRVQRQAGIKRGDRLTFRVSPRTVTIRAEAPTYKPTKAELSAIRKGEAAIARGEYVSLSDFLHELDRRRRKTGAEAIRKVSR